MSGEFHRRLTSEFLGRAVTYDQTNTILGLFESCAREWPDAPAVTFGQHTLTYQELDRRANGLAELLAEQGIGRGDFLPLAVDDGLELPLSMIAAMKLAAPFVPIDDSNPADRFAAMVDTLDAKLVLHSAGSGQCSGGSALTVDAAALSELSHPPRIRPAGLDELAYGFYTSGSTGLPKCALNVHRGLLNRFAYMTRRFGRDSGRVVLQNSRRHFDSSLWQLLWPLTIGNRVVIPERSDILDLAAAIDVIERHQVTMTDFVPSIFNALVGLLRARPPLVQRLTSLRRLLIGGEEITATAVHTFRLMLPQVAIVNTYGPTEAAIGSIFHEVNDDDADSIPIGLPIDNTYAVVVDERMRPAPAGDIGEICIGGECLGAGYLKDQEKTNAVFVENPFPEIPGSRLYRTGDRGYRRPDGLLHFVGRIDHQVKINGHRIELSEVENALLRHPEVREAKVIVHCDSTAKLMVAFVTRRSGGAADADEMRAHASAALPRQLVPRHFFVLDRMPLTLNGKVDRRELMRLAVQRMAPGDRSHRNADRDATETAILALWRELLPFAELGPEMDFFEVGGDSLSAQRLATALTEWFGIHVTARNVFDCPTLGQQVSLVGRDKLDADPGRVRNMALLHTDAVFTPPDTVPDPAEGPTLRHVLLTGATGFIGAHILYELLTRTSASAHCLVRAPHASSARQRVVANLVHYRLWDDAFASRITAVPGDLEGPRLGLLDDMLPRITKGLDTIIHVGAMVNMVRDYRAHRKVNVHGTAELLRLAMTERLKAVHFVSTVGAFPAGAHGLELIPEAPVPPTGAPVGGYAQSKWVAERLLTQAAAHGLPVTVHRLAEVMPHSRTGVPNQRGFPDLLIRACLRTGMWFRSPVLMDYTPADLAGAVIVAAAVRGERGYFHTIRREGISLDELLRCFGERFNLTEVSYPTFWHALRDASQEDSDDRSHAIVLALLPEPAGESETAVADAFAKVFSDNIKAISRLNAQRLAERAGLLWRPDVQDMFHRYAEYYCSAWAESVSPSGKWIPVV